MKTWLIAGVVGAVVVGATLSMVLLFPKKSPDVQSSSSGTTGQPVPTPASTPADGQDMVIGRYAAYDKSAAMNAAYDTTLLFFHAPWCVECRGFENAITDGTIPNNVQILKVDYDSSVDLRKQYGVTIQSTFVRVNSAGEKQAMWVGYGKDKSVDVIIQNTR